MQMVSSEHCSWSVVAMVVGLERVGYKKDRCRGVKKGFTKAMLCREDLVK